MPLTHGADRVIQPVQDLAYQERRRERVTEIWQRKERLRNNAVVVFRPHEFLCPSGVGYEAIFSGVSSPTSCQTNAKWMALPNENNDFAYVVPPSRASSKCRSHAIEELPFGPFPKDARSECTSSPRKSISPLRSSPGRQQRESSIASSPSRQVAPCRQNAGGAANSSILKQQAQNFGAGSVGAVKSPMSSQMNRRAPGQMQEYAPGQMREYAPGQTLEGSPGQRHNSEQGKMRGGAQSRTPRYAPSQMSGCSPGAQSQTPQCAPGQMRCCAPSHTAEYAPSQMRECAPAHMPGCAQSQTYGCAPGQMPGCAPSQAFGCPASKLHGCAPSQAPSQMYGCAPGQTHGYAPYQMYGCAPGQTHGCAPSQMYGCAPGQTPGGAPSQAPGYAPRQMYGCAPGQTHGYAPSQMYGCAPGQTPGCAPSHLSGFASSHLRGCAQMQEYPSGQTHGCAPSQTYGFAPAATGQQMCGAATNRASINRAPHEPTVHVQRSEQGQRREQPVTPRHDAEPGLGARPLPHRADAKPTSILRHQGHTAPSEQRHPRTRNPRSTSPTPHYSPERVATSPSPPRSERAAHVRPHPHDSLYEYAEFGAISARARGAPSEPTQKTQDRGAPRRQEYENSPHVRQRKNVTMMDPRDAAQLGSADTSQEYENNDGVVYTSRAHGHGASPWNTTNAIYGANLI